MGLVKPKSEKPVREAMKYLEKKVHLTQIITLPQMRTRFDPEGIVELADKIISAQGIINPPIVAILPPKDFWDYSSLVCKVYGKNLSANEIKQIKNKITKGSAKVLIAGERRLKACMLLWNEGCSECRQNNNGKKIGNGVCWKKHFNTTSRMITVRVPVAEINHLLEIQFAENVHDRPSAYEEADAVAKYAIFLKSANKKISYEKIAERMGRSSEMVRRSLMFYALPVSVKNLVAQKLIKFGHAVELAKLHDQLKYSEVDLLREINVAMSDKRLHKVEAFAQRVAGLILAYKQKQNSTITELEMVLEVISPEKQMARLLNPETVRMARLFTSNFSKVITLLESRDNKAFSKGRKFSIGGFFEDFLKMVPLIKQILPYVEQEVTVQEAKALRKDFQEIKNVLHKRSLLPKTIKRPRRKVAA